MGSVFKKFTAQDKAIIPFNAHKQYQFNSASAAANSLTWITSSATSESVSLYSSASNIYGGDKINLIKYQQIDHLFYRNFKTELGNKAGYIKHLKQHRELYKKANILSIPSGLIGFEIRPGSFYLSSSNDIKIIDDLNGNLIISGTILGDYPTDPNQNVFKLGPIKGFEKYDLDVYDKYAVLNQNRVDLGFHNEIYGSFWRRGKNKPGDSGSYTSAVNRIPLEYYTGDYDDSYFINPLYYKDVSFTEFISSSSQINFQSFSSSYISSPHDEKFNFDKDEDFTISFWMEPQPTGSQSDMLNTEKRYIIAKSGTKTVTPQSASIDQKQIAAEPQFPFEIYLISQSLHFDISDGDSINSIVGEVTNSAGTATGSAHILCQKSSSRMEMWYNGVRIASSSFNLLRQTRNTANLFIGSKGEYGTFPDHRGGEDKHFNGNLSNINIWSRAYNSSTIKNISSSLNGSPYIGNLFYQHGFAIITHPLYQYVLTKTATTSSLETIEFQGSHLIYEHEYQCTINENEFNSTYNLSARKVRSQEKPDLADFTTGSLWSPYITTIGLYNEEGELLVVGKLAQPIKCSDETDTTFVLRWDT